MNTSTKAPDTIKRRWVDLVVQGSVLFLVVGGLVALVGLLFLPGCGADPEKNAVTLPSGVKYIELTEGSGEGVKPGDVVEVHYEGFLREDGKPFESTRRANDPFICQVGERGNPKGMALGLAGMKLGGKRRTIVPAKLAFGSEGFGEKVPANADVVYEVEVLRILEPAETEDLKEGTGDAVKMGSTVRVFYTGRMKNVDEPFDSNVGKEPVTFTIGMPPGLKGWHQGLIGMKVGGKRPLTLRPELAYAEKGAPEKGIPAGATITFEFELVEILR